MVTESLEGLGVERGGETTDGVLVDVLGRLGEDAHSRLEDGERAVILELDNVLVGDESVGITAGNQQRRRLGALGGRAEDGREQGEEDGQTHREGSLRLLRVA